MGVPVGGYDSASLALIPNSVKVDSLGFPRRRKHGSMVPGWQDVAMGAAIGLRAATTEDPRNANQSRRLRALAEIYDCGSRCDAARIGSVGLQIVRDWGLRC